MDKALLRTPLQQALVLLWLVGLGQLAVWLAMGNPLGGLFWSALAGAILSAGVAGRLRRPGLLSVAVVLGLGVVLVVTEHLGITTTPLLALLTALYGLLLWLAVVRTLRLPPTGRIIRLLNLQGGYGESGGRQAVESSVHWSSLALTLLALGGLALLHWVPAALPAAPLPVLAVSLVFLGLAGWRYRLRLHSYLVIALGAWGVLSLYAGLITALGVLLPADPWLGLLLAWYGLIAWVVAQQLATRFLRSVEQPSVAYSLYAEPLQIAAVVLATLAFGQVLGLLLTDTLMAPGWIAMACSGVVALLLLLPNRTLTWPFLILAGSMLALLTLLWLYSAAVHGLLPFDLWPGGSAGGDQWLVLAVLVLILAGVAQFITQYPPWNALYTPPLFLGAWLAYGWTLLGALTLFEGHWTLYLSALLAILIIALFPLLRPLKEAADWRGIGVALLLSLLAASLLGPARLQRWGSLAAMSWAYGLWIGGNLLLPPYNARFPSWAVAPETWPWFGLLLLFSGMSLEGPVALLHAGYILAAAAYLFLMLRNSAWPGFAWLTVLALAWAGMVYSGARYSERILTLNPSALVGMAGEQLLWANLLLLGIPWWRRYGGIFTVRLGWQAVDWQAPLLTAAFFLSGLWLLILISWDAVMIFIAIWDLATVGEPSAVFLGGLLSISLFHGLYRWRSKLAAQLLILAVFCTLLAAWGLLRPFYLLPLLLVLWGFALVALSTLFTPDSEGLRGLLGQALLPWATLTPLATLAALLLLPGMALSERLLTLALLAGNTALLGWRRRERGWLLGTATLVIVFLHGLGLLWVPLNRAFLLLPWTAVQMALLTGGLRWLGGYLLKYQETAAPQAKLMSELVVTTLAQIRPWVAVLAVVEWVLYTLNFAFTLLTGLSPQQLAAGWDSGAALLCAVLLVTLGISEARRSQQAIWVYGVTLLAGLSGVYLRLLWVGPAPLSVWDTAAIMGAAYGLFILQRFTLSRPVLQLVLVLPLLALLTVPIQLGSTQTACTLLAAAMLYLLTRRATGLETPLYLGLLTLNGGLYLWVPTWAEQTGLFQIYLIPAVLTVLVLLQLHRRELRPGVLNSARLAALSTLYAAATLDVFLQADLAVFILALALSITGIVLGIGLRIRAFLYAGVTFLVLNVLGQLLKLYPEQRLGRALVLMALGAVIIGLMIWFNIKREAILQRIRVFRADLAEWS
jgi:hypothetical protein